MKQLELQYPTGSSHEAIVAEIAFIALLQKWLDLVYKLAPSEHLSRKHDKYSMSCLLLSVEWGHVFSPTPFKLVKKCLRIVNSRRPGSWYDELVWVLCLAARLKNPSRSNAVDNLIMNFDHCRSQIRLIMLELGWFVKPWLNHPSAMYHLLMNLPYSHMYSELAYVLAAQISGNDPNFVNSAAECNIPNDRKDLYLSLLNDIVEKEVPRGQQHFWHLECECRKMIADESLGCRALGLAP